MNKHAFNGVVAECLSRTSALLIRKGEEYAGDADRLANFKRAAEKQGVTVLEVWQTYWAKHVDSINTYMARVRDEAMTRALCDEASIVRDGETLVSIERFRRNVDTYLPLAMATIDAQLSEPIEGRFDDNINYSFLALALIEELRASVAPVGDSRP